MNKKVQVICLYALSVSNRISVILHFYFSVEFQDIGSVSKRSLQSLA